MENGPTRAAFWKRFVYEKCEYPAPTLLRNQLENSDYTEFCECGCNSFGLRVDSVHQKPLLPPRDDVRLVGHAAIFTADFKLPDETTLEIVIFADDHGHLDYVEVSCCANSYPVPDQVAVDGLPTHTWAADNIFRER